jgi:hypothetical protein
MSRIKYMELHIIFILYCCLPCIYLIRHTRTCKMNCVNRVLQTELNAVSFPTPSLPRHSSSSRHPPPTGTPTPETTCLTQKFQWGTNICWGNHLWLFFDRDLWPPFPNTSNDRTAVSNVHVDLVAKWVFFPHPFHSVVFHCHLHRGNRTPPLPHPYPKTRAQPSQAAWTPSSRS